VLFPGAASGGGADGASGAVGAVGDALRQARMDAATKRTRAFGVLDMRERLEAIPERVTSIFRP
jgi:hypothetical protein